MTDQLSLYNGALRILKERRLADLTENREPRRLLDGVWNDGAVKYCLQSGQWTFATRTARLDYSPSVEPPFGYRYAFDQPEDMVRVTGIWHDERCIQPLLQYTDERHFWYCDLTTIYVSFVSNLPNYGGDFSLWPETFVQLVQAFLALQIAGNLTQGQGLIALADRAWEKARLAAASLDAQNKPTKFLPESAWTAARRGRRSRDSYWNGEIR